MLKKAIFLTVITTVIYACATVPLTGRRQLNLVSNSEIIPMAEKEYREVIAKGPLSTNAQQTQMVKNVGARIQKAVEKYLAEKNLSDQLAGFNWEFNLIDDPKTVNAWCMPGGKVAFYTGIMPICKDESGIAVVMGHEVAHAIANHGRERMSQGLLQQLGMSSISAAMGQNPTMTSQIFYQAVGLGSQVGMLKFSRTHESEADEIGLIFMAIAGYDPREAPKFWERMAAGSKGSTPEWLSTHPSDETRIADLNKQLPKALKYYEKYKQ
ncbi:MAG TPA: M48 family metallopeptidase [Cyclobacteriaceae bacterium]|nr:M48 family metallopeptidase [Cyclobacteriaceae bacterium]HMV09844.1 M48 family metallopeptidase [Cyclobacteriaceae bacterium]HMV91757.1 M48 family metallopeptidase [Cyclobacteriaceae bacterium]HMX00447.1 M48 family metallopeptidase [Cyclobacteriaceae bacterium]HMX50469.1 M48 family metallopeptidase [Cyclobacteriaceae bacterium]